MTTSSAVPQQSLIEKEIAELYQQVHVGERRGKQAARFRKILAYMLKIVAGGGSLAVATGYFSDWNKLIGVAILVALFLDTVSSNHKRLLALVKAGYAYESLRENVKGQYNRQLDPQLKVLRKHDRTPEEERNAQTAIEDLQNKTHFELSDGIASIKKSLAEVDIKALEALALDNERAAAHQ